MQTKSNWTEIREREERTRMCSGGDMKRQVDKACDVRDIQDDGTTRIAVPTACETRWTKSLASFERHRDAIIAGLPDAKDETGLVHNNSTATSHFAFRKWKRRCLDETGRNGSAV
jgi:hypothetical protein